ncbi:MAG: hypothetical protein JXM75_05490 [Chromatiaceae bacterium]|nr:hypothetical protein [Chromatiaceae bacterium]
MAEPRYDLSFRAILQPGTDADQARARLRELFRLDEAGAARLFSGQPVVVKRAVDAKTAAQYERVFSEVGAVLERLELNATPNEAPSPPPSASQAPAVDATTAKGLAALAASSLALAPQEGFLEAEREVKIPPIDTEHLALVGGADWSLEDCEQPPTPIPEPDISHLSLVAIEPREDESPERDIADD